MDESVKVIFVGGPQDGREETLPTLCYSWHFRDLPSGDILTMRNPQAAWDTALIHVYELKIDPQLDGWYSIDDAERYQFVYRGVYGSKRQQQP